MSKIKTLSKINKKMILWLLLLINLPSIAQAETGIASWYSSMEVCKYRDPCLMANGEDIRDAEKNGEKFAASYDYSFNTHLKITNLANQKQTSVYIFDRGPAKRLGRLIDLSKSAFAEIADPKEGLIKVNIEKL